MPAPKQTWPVAGRSTSKRSGSCRRIAIGGCHKDQHLAVCGDLMAADLDIARGDECGIGDVRKVHKVSLQRDRLSYFDDLWRGFRTFTFGQEGEPHDPIR
jgi:hypothetical protein